MEEKICEVTVSAGRFGVEQGRGNWGINVA